MRDICEEAKADERRAARVAAGAGQDRDGGRMVTRVAAGAGLASAKTDEAMSEQTKKWEDGRYGEAGLDQDTMQLSSRPNEGPKGRSAEPSGVKTAQPDRQQGGGEGLSEREYHDIDGTAEPSAISAQSNRIRRSENRNNRAAAGTGAGHVDKASLAISTPRRIRDKEHLRYVASQPCIICGRTPGQAHHLRFTQPRALARKVSDEWTVPLCSTHHRALHNVGDEKQWWTEKGIDPVAHAVRLWWDTRHGGVEHSSKVTAGRSHAVFDGHEEPQAVARQVGAVNVIADTDAVGGDRR